MDDHITELSRGAPLARFQRMQVVRQTSSADRPEVFCTNLLAFPNSLTDDGLFVTTAGNLGASLSVRMA
jgi:hypothetical protein